MERLTAEDLAKIHRPEGMPALESLRIARLIMAEFGELVEWAQEAIAAYEPSEEALLATGTPYYSEPCDSHPEARERGYVAPLRPPDDGPERDKL